MVQFYYFLYSLALKFQDEQDIENQYQPKYIEKLCRTESNIDFEKQAI